MIRLDRQPTATDLKLFGASLSFMLCVVGLLLWFQMSWRGLAVGLWIAAGALLVTYYAIPAVQRPLYRGWIVLMFPLAWLMSVVILGILYFGLITPIGLLSRLFGRDPLKLRSSANSYWIERPVGRTPKSRYFRQH